MHGTLPEPGTAPAAPPTRSWLEPPGGLLMWIVVTLELFTFALILAFVATFRGQRPDAFAEGQALLAPGWGLLQTVVLLTSGWLVAEGVHAYRAGRIHRARRFHGVGIVLGLGFVGLKVQDYVTKSAAGMGLEEDFGAAYFLTTGFHLLHVLVGLAMLAYVVTRMGRKPYEDEETAVGGTALFWHMCDIVWFFLFALFYVR